MDEEDAQDMEAGDGGGGLLSASKRPRMSTEERLKRSRERNRMHAKKTRQRKKIQMDAMQRRIGDLKGEFAALKQIVEERYTAHILIVMSGAMEKGDGMSFGGGGGLSASEMTAHSMAEILGRELQDDERGGADGDGVDNDPASSCLALLSGGGDGASGDGVGLECGEDMDDEQPAKRVRRRGKYTPQERETIRRERNRMHAKRTRDRKKLFLEEAEQTIKRMEGENLRLRAFMGKHQMLDATNAVPVPVPVDMPALLKSLDSMDSIEQLDAFEESNNAAAAAAAAAAASVARMGMGVGMGASSFVPCTAPHRSVSETSTFSSRTSSSSLASLSPSMASLASSATAEPVASPSSMKLTAASVRSLDSSSGAPPAISSSGSGSIIGKHGGASLSNGSTGSCSVLSRSGSFDTEISDEEARSVTSSESSHTASTASSLGTAGVDSLQDMLTNGSSSEEEYYKYNSSRASSSSSSDAVASS